MSPKLANTQIRCPFCMNEVTSAHHRESKERESCDRCGHGFRVRDALDASFSGVAQEIAPAASESGWGDQHGELLYSGACFLALVLFSVFSTNARGMTWIYAYLGFGAVLLIVATYVRLSVSDTILATLVPFVAFEAAAGFRYWYGTTHLDMHRWTYLMWAA